MPRSKYIAKILVGFITLAATSTMFAKERVLKVVYCVPGPQDSWSLQKFKPLISPRGKTVFAEMTLADHMLLEIKLRRFSADSEVAFDYKFDAAGRLNALEGSVNVFGEWVGEANLLPDADGTVAPYQVMYRRGNERVPKPEDAANYVALLNKAPIYQTVQAVPCAGMMKEAEKIDATQE